MKKMRILFNSNAIWATSGYSMQIADLLPLIRDEGYPLAIINYFGQTGGKFILDGIIQYPVINHIYGSDAMVLHGKDFKADVIFSLQDQWVLHPQDLQQLQHWIPITPVDHDPAPKGILQNLKFAYRIISYSRFGEKMLKDNGFYSTYIPHTVNTDIFKPLNKDKRKKESQMPEDCFLIGMVAANKDFMSRKAFQESLEAFKEFLTVEPKALLYIHTNPQYPGGFPIDKFAEFLGIRDKVIFPDVYDMNFNMGKEQMNLVYNTFDVLLAPSKTEGFCVPLIEAQACGVPVITHRWNSMTELVQEEKTGYLVDPLSKQWQPNESYQAIPSVPSIVEALVKVHKQNRVEMGYAARKFMVENYDTKKVFETYWKPYLAMLEKELCPEEKKK